MKEKLYVCRPGEMNITERAVQLCGWKKFDRIADLGCGTGASLDYMEAVFGILGTGVELEPAFCDGERIVYQDASRLPYEADSMDGALMECSLSRMGEPEKVLTECVRVLKPGAFLAVSDMVAEGIPVTEPVPEKRSMGTPNDIEREKTAGFPAETLGRLESESQIEERFRQVGLQIWQVENHNKALKQWFGQLLFTYGRCRLEEILGLPWDRVKQAQCGYRLWILRKKDKWRCENPEQE